MAPNGDPRKLRAIKARDRVYQLVQQGRAPKPIIVTRAGASVRLRFPDGKVYLITWDELLTIADRAPLVTPSGAEVTGIHAIARSLPP